MKSDSQYYVEQGNKKIHFYDLIFDELDNSGNSEKLSKQKEGLLVTTNLPKPRGDPRW